MNPSSPFTYYRRHKRSAVLLVSLIALVTVGVSVMVGALSPIMNQASMNLAQLTRLSRVSPVGDLVLDPIIVSQIRAHPDVARTIPEVKLSIFVPSLLAVSELHVSGVPEADLEYLLEVYDVRLKEGRMLQSHTNEIVLSEEVVSALGLRIGDQIDRSVNTTYYQDILSPLVLVGIVESAPLTIETDPLAWEQMDKQIAVQGIRVGFASYEYLNSHAMFASRPSRMLVVAQKGRREAVNSFLETSIPLSRTYVETFGQEAELIRRGRQMFYFIMGIVDGLVAVVVALVIGAINQIALSHRTQEFGLLNAVGHHKGRLLRRLALEMTAVTGSGWIIGLALSRLILVWASANFYGPRGWELDLTDLAPFWFVVPIPLIVIGFATLSIARMFGRFDAVAIIERDKLSMESGEIAKRKAPRSFVRPLSSLTFYVRHRRRGLMLVATMALMIVGVASPIFLLSPTLDAMQPRIEQLRPVSMVLQSVGRAVDPGVAAQIRTHPDVARVVPTIALPLEVFIPPFSVLDAILYGVSEPDMAYLVDLYGVSLKEGRLPHPRTNEVAISETLATNRSLRVGDAIGQPVYERDVGIPTEMVVVGILSTGEDAWLGFASFEYLQNHERYVSHQMSLLVVPAGGRKAELDAWLEKDVASKQTEVSTYDILTGKLREATNSLLLVLMAVESVVAIVAVVALAALNYIFFSQRRREFGVLYAIGNNRPWLLLRTAKETMTTVGLAWCVGAVLCGIIVLSLQTSLYAPRGLNLDFFNPAPWLFTLPIPIAVVVASAGPVAWMLTRLDPVAIIERR
jgi:ABC-type lipoprotein release transport system permease subunit